MPVSTRLDPLGLDIQVLLDEIEGPTLRSAALADAAREAIADADRTNEQALGRVPPRETFVDGRKTDDISSVRPDGVVSVEYDLIEDVFAWIGEQLVKHSPIGDASDRRPGHPGLYMASHVFFADGVEIEPGAPVPVAGEYVFTNIQPYARKIERGLSDQAPDGVYQSVAQLAQRRFGNIAQIRFSYRVPAFGAINEWAQRTAMLSPGRRGVQREEWLRRQPAVVIVPR